MKQCGVNIHQLNSCPDEGIIANQSVEGRGPLDLTITPSIQSSAERSAASVVWSWIVWRMRHSRVIKGMQRQVNKFINLDFAMF